MIVRDDNEDDTMARCVMINFIQSLPGTTSLHAVIFERHSWQDARLRCRRLLHSKAHLVVIDDDAENTAIKNHLFTFNSKYNHPVRY